MATVGVCALIIWLAPILVENWFMWTVYTDVGRGRSRYSPLAYPRIGPRSVQWLRDALKSNQKTARLAAVQTLGNIGHDGIAAISELARPAIPDLIDAALLTEPLCIDRATGGSRCPVT
jgi:hypothetical protein